MDWRLPTKRELNLMHVVYSNGGGASLNSRFTAGVLRSAITITRGTDFDDGNQDSASKDNTTVCVLFGLFSYLIIYQFN